MPNFDAIGKAFVQASMISKRQSDKILNGMQKDLSGLNRQTNTEALALYRSLENRLDVEGSTTVLVSSMDNLEKLSRWMPELEVFINNYRVAYARVYNQWRLDVYQQMTEKERRLEKVLERMDVHDDRVTIGDEGVAIMNSIYQKMLSNVNAVLLKWKNYVYDVFFQAITQSSSKKMLEDTWVNDSGTLKIGSSLEEMTESEAAIAAVAERTAYLREQAKINDYKYCWNVNPMDQRTKPECINACLAGVIPEATMGTDYGFPPRYVCRCEIAYTRGEWVELNSGINKEIEKVRVRLIDSLLNAPKQKAVWYVGATKVVPADPARAAGTKMYADIEEKLALVEGMSVPEFRMMTGGV